MVSIREANRLARLRAGPVTWRRRVTYGLLLFVLVIISLALWALPFLLFLV